MRDRRTSRRAPSSDLSPVVVDAAIPPTASVFVDGDVSVRNDLAARWLAEALRDVLSRQDTAVLALVGGSSVGGVHEALAAADLDWDRVLVTVGDERAVPADSPDRNWRVVERLVTPLVEAGRLPTDNLVGLPDLPDDATPADVEAAVQEVADRIDHLDVVLLGMGDDGHVASLFPHHPGLSATGRFTVVTDSPKPPPLRMSATVAMIAGASAIALVGAGDAKADAVATVQVEGPLADVPGRIIHLAPRSILVTDRPPTPEHD